jgi:DNA-binding transcriptional ArsR family regulator
MPPWGYTVDFLTPIGGPTELNLGLEKVLRTPLGCLRREVAQFAAGKRLPTWVRNLAEGELDVLRGLVAGLHSYFATFLAPHWAFICARIEAERSRLAVLMLSGGVEQVLNALHPAIRWDAPVLEIDSPGGLPDRYLDGRGIQVVPSFFCCPGPTHLADPELPFAIAYPIGVLPSWYKSPRIARDELTKSLTALLGATRAHVFEILADCERNTSELAKRAGVSRAAASLHAAVLREAGLVVSQRRGPSMMHAVTPLGQQFLTANSCA